MTDLAFNFSAEWHAAILQESERREFSSLMFFGEIWFPCMVKLGAIKCKRDDD